MAKPRHARKPHPLTVYRLLEGISPAELSRRLGVTRSAVCRYESGERAVDRNLWPKFSEITKIPVTALAGLEEWKPTREVTE